MKSSKFLLTSLLAAAAMSIPAYAETAVGDTTYSGSIYTWANTASSEADLAFGAWQATTWDSATSSYSYGSSITSWNNDIKNIIASSSTSADLNTIRFDASVGSNPNMCFTFNPLAVAGIIVEEGASDYVIYAEGRTNTASKNRAVYIGNGNSTAAFSTFHENFKISFGTTPTYSSGTAENDTMFFIRGTQTWTIDAGKTFTLDTGTNVHATNFSGTTTITGGGAANFSGAGTISMADGSAINVSGGSTLILGKSVALASGATSASISVDTGSTLDLSAGSLTVAANVTAASGAVLELGAITANSAALSATGNVTLSEGTIFRIDSYVAGAQLVSSSGTLTAAGVTSGDVSGMGVANLYIGGLLANQRGTAVFTVTDNALVLSSYTFGALNLTWNGGEDGTWKANGSEGWLNSSEATNFQNGDNVTFGADTNNSVTIAENLIVGTLTTSAATTLSVADGSAASVSASTLSLGANLTLNSGVTLKMTQTATGSNDVTNMFSNVAGTGTLSIILPNSNGLGVYAPNFAGTLYIQKPSGSESRLQLTSTTLADGASIELADGADLVLNATMERFSHDIKINGETELYFNSTSSESVEFSGDITGAGTLSIVSNNNPRTLVLSGNVDLGGISVGSNKSLTLSGTAKFGSISASGKTLTVNGGSLTISGAAASTIGTLAVNGGSLTISGAAASTIGTLSGTGTLTKTGAGTLTLTPANFSLASLKVGAGTVAFGGLSSASFGTSTTIEVSNGGNVDFNLSNKDDKTFSGTLVLKNGGKITKKDGSLVLGDVQLGETSTDTVYLLGDWGKGGTKITGALSGAATVYLANAGNMNKAPNLGNTDVERFTISGRDNSYSGTLIVGKQSASTTSATHKTILIVGSETALKNAKVNLALGDKSAMWLGASSVTISGLAGTANSTVELNSDDSSITASTLRVNQTANTTFAGTIADGIALKKAGAGTLTLAGASTAFNGSVKVSGGVLALADASAIGSGNAVRIDGGQLKVGNGTTAVSLNAAAYTIVLSDAYSEGSGVAAIVGTDATNKSSVALATDTKITIELADSVAVSLAAEAAQYQYKIFDTATIDDASFTIASFALSEALKSAWRISGYKNGVLTIAAIPEPSVFGLLAGLGALALAGTRRRRKKA